MKSRVLSLALALGAATALTTFGQQPPPLPVPPQPGGGPQGQAVNRWASQVLLESQQLRTALAASPSPRLRELSRPAERLHDRANQFYRLAKTSPDRNRLRREFPPLDQELTAVVASVRAAARAERQPAVLTAASQLEYAGEQLSYHLAHDDNDAGRRRDWLLRQTRALDAQSDELLRTARELFNTHPVTLQLERTVRSFTVAVDRFRRVVETNAPRPQVAETFREVGMTWNTVSADVHSSPAARPYSELRRQADQVGQLVQNIAGIVGVPVPQARIELPDLAPGAGVKPQRTHLYAVGADSGGGPHVRVFFSRRSSDFASFFAYDPDFKGGVRVAVGDVTAEGTPDLVTAPGPGMAPLIRVFDGRTMAPLREFLAFDPPYQQGCWVAAGDLLRNRGAEVVVGTDEGVPTRVRIFDAMTGRATHDVIPYEPGFRGGVRVALGDVNGDGTPDLITVPGPGRPVTVRVFDGRNLGNVLGQFDAYEPRFQGGGFVTAADLTGSGRTEIVTGAGTNGGPHVRVFTTPTGRLMGEFFAYDERFLGGVRVACCDVNGNGVPEILTTPGPGMPPLVRAFDTRTRQQVFEFSAFDPQFQGGAFIAGR